MVGRARRSDARKQISFTSRGAASASIQSVIDTALAPSRLKPFPSGYGQGSWSFTNHTWCVASGGHSMVASDTTVETSRPWSPHVRGHFLQFDARPVLALSTRTGARLLLSAALLEIARLTVIAAYPAIPRWLLLPLLTGMALLAVTAIAGLPLSPIGLVPWGEWSAPRKSYTLQVIIFANILFTMIRGSPLAAGAGRLWTVFVPYLFFRVYP